MMKFCSSKGKGDKTGACGSYNHCINCQYRVFFIMHMLEEYGEDLVLAKDEQDWLDNVYTKLDEDDLRYVMGKYAPETPSPHRPKKDVKLINTESEPADPAPTPAVTSAPATESVPAVQTIPVVPVNQNNYHI